MSDSVQHPCEFGLGPAVEVYGDFLQECVEAYVSKDRVRERGPGSRKSQIDGRPVRLVTISGKGGWCKDPERRANWERSVNISLLDHLLSVARGALILWSADTRPRWSDPLERKRLYALVCIAFLHDVDKDLKLRRGQKIEVSSLEERMRRYGIDEFLSRHDVTISPAAMLNYIEESEATQAARTPAAPDYDRRIAAICRYVEMADKLEGKFVDTRPGQGVDGVIASLRDPNRWPALRNQALRHWEKVEIHDPLHVFLLDRFQRALSESCAETTGLLPLVEVVHDGRLLCVVPKDHASEVRTQALDRFASSLHAPLRFAVNNRLACEFTGAAASWEKCRDAMDPRGDWGSSFRNLLSLPKAYAQAYREEINALYEMAGMEASWSRDTAPGATVKSALDHPGGDTGELDMAPAHALAFLVISLNHKDCAPSEGTPGTEERENELLNRWADNDKQPPEFVLRTEDARARRALLALWSIGSIWLLADDDPNEAQDLLDSIIGRNGLAGRWLEGQGGRAGLVSEIEDTSGEAVRAVRQRFEARLAGRSASAFESGDLPKHCLLCNEPVTAARRISTADRAHGVKISAFSGRDGRNDHLASPAGDTHLCLVCLKELQLRQAAQDEYRGAGDLPPLISSPVTTGLFGGLAFQSDNPEVSMGFYDLIRLDVRKGAVYHGLDCQTRRIRIARLERLPETDEKLVAWLHRALEAIRRIGRPVHIFRGAPRRHPGFFYCDALPGWLERLLGGNSLRIEQLKEAQSQLELFARLAEAPGLGVQWAKQLADPKIRLGALCVAWTVAVDRKNSGNSGHNWLPIRRDTREKALAHIRNPGGEQVNLKDNPDPLVHLAWLATGIQKRINIRDSANKQRLCWKVALEYYMGARGVASVDRDALVLGLASTLEETLRRGKNNLVAKKHREGKTDAEGCIEFAGHFVDSVWPNVFGSKDPTLQEQRRAGAIYRFALLEAYRERGIPESENGASTDDAH